MDYTVPLAIPNNSRVRKKSSGEFWKCCRSLPSGLSCCIVMNASMEACSPALLLLLLGLCASQPDERAETRSTPSPCVRLSAAVLEQESACCHALPVQLCCLHWCSAVLLLQNQELPAFPGTAVVMNSSLVNLSKCLALATGLVLFALIMWVFAC